VLLLLFSLRMENEAGFVSLSKSVAATGALWSCCRASRSC
jgi:hypothetical protein